jgi:hypothetical protein
VYGQRAVVYGTIANNGTVTKQIDYTIPQDMPCGSSLKITMYIQSSLGYTSIDKNVYLGNITTSYTENFDSVTAPAIPTGWTAETNYTPIKFVTTNVQPDSAPNSAFAADLPNCGNPGGPGCPTSAGGTTELISPSIPITISGARLTFQHKFNTEDGWDGGVLDISYDGTNWEDIKGAGGVFEVYGYNSALGPGINNLIGGRFAWTGNSGGWKTTVVRLPPSAAGKNVRLRWRFGADNNTAPPGGGWNVDSINIASNAACSYTP